MACKSWSATSYRRRTFAQAGPYVSFGIGLQLEVGQSWDLRTSFAVNNDPGASDCTGELRFQMRGPGYPDWSAMAVVSGSAEVKTVEAGTLYFRAFAPPAPGNWRTRTVLLYAGDPSAPATTFEYPSNPAVEVTFTVTEAGRVGELDEFFRGDELGTTAVINGLMFPGAFDDPYRGHEMMEGHRPSLLVETALELGIVEHGQAVTVVDAPGRTFAVRGKQRRDGGTTLLVLEETT